MDHKKILLIEDDLFLSDIYKTKFEQVGYIIQVAENGAEGVKKARASQPDLILLDIVLPKMNGIEVLDQLKSAEGTKSIPVVFLTNLGSDEDIKEGLKKGAAGYLVKSQFTPSEVVAEVEKILKK